MLVVSYFIHERILLKYFDIKSCAIFGVDDRGTQVSISGQYNFLSFQIKPVDKK